MHDWLVLLILVPGMALTAWATNSLLLFLLLHPVNFVGLRPFLGWRGIVPARAAKIAHPLVLNITTQVGTVAELYSTLGPSSIAEHLSHTLRPRVGELIEDTILEEFPDVWDDIDESIIRKVTTNINERLAPVLRDFMDNIGANIDHFLSVRALTQARLVEHPELLVKLFENVGDREFRFIRRAGAWLGAVAGLVATLVALWHDGWISLSVTGAIGLGLSNTLILLLVFYPRQPVRWGRLVLQGHFPKRQEEAAVVACRLFTRDVIGLQPIMDLILHGERSNEIHATLRRLVRPVIDAATTDLAEVLTPRLGTRGFERLRERIAQHTVDVTRVPFDDPIFNHERQIVVESTFLDRLLEMAPIEFEQLLRPAFNDVEWMLVAGGGLAGALFGLAIGTLVAT